MRIFGLVLILVFTSCASTKKNEGMIKNKKARIFYDQGTQELNDKEYTMALTHLQQANKNDPNNTHILNNLGMAYYFKGATGTGIKFLNKSLKIDNKNTPARMNLATIYMKNKQYDLAEQEYKKILKDLNYLAQFRTYYNLGVLSKVRGDNKTANNYFEKSIEENEGYCPAHFQLGEYHYKAKDYKSAFKKFKDASFGVCFENPVPHYHQAKSLIKLGKFDEARISLNKIVDQFSSTKYVKLANSALKYIDKVETKDYLDKNAPRRRNRKILTPDF